MAFDALEAASLLEASAIAATVLAVSSLRPFPAEEVLQAASGARLVVTVENHGVEGGLGSLVRRSSPRAVSVRASCARASRRGGSLPEVRPTSALSSASTPPPWRAASARHCERREALL